MPKPIQVNVISNNQSNFPANPLCRMKKDTRSEERISRFASYMTAAGVAMAGGVGGAGIYSTGQVPQVSSSQEILPEVQPLDRLGENIHRYEASFGATQSQGNDGAFRVDAEFYRDFKNLVETTQNQIQIERRSNDQQPVAGNNAPGRNSEETIAASEITEVEGVTDREPLREEHRDVDVYQKIVALAARTRDNKVSVHRGTSASGENPRKNSRYDLYLERGESSNSFIDKLNAVETWHQGRESAARFGRRSR